MVSWALVFAKQALKDAKKMTSTGLKPKVQDLLAILAANPLQHPPPNEKLIGDLAGAYSRRINFQGRLVYEVFVEEKIVRVCCACGRTMSESNKSPIAHSHQTNLPDLSTA